MELLITRVLVAGFRNYERFEFEPDPSLTVLVGRNAVGKTNLIEAIELLTEADSFRKPVWTNVVKEGAETAYASLRAESPSSRLDIEVEIDHKGRRRYAVNGKAQSTIAGVAGRIPCVLFTPDDLKIVKDPPERRRSTVDALGVQLSPVYAQLKGEYERVVRQRNVLLRERASDSRLFPWTEQLVSLGSLLIGHRMRLFARLLSPMAELYSQLSGGGALEAEYLPSWARDGVADKASPPEEAMRTHLAKRATAEKARRMSLSGPHRDEIVFTVEGREARAFGSQGQQRTVALAWKLAEVAVVKDVAGRRPILLLDDVMSELDEPRRHALASFVGSVAQTVVTTTNLGYFDEELLSRARVVELK